MNPAGFPTTLFWLLVSHAVCDYPLQGDFLARGKNHTNPLPGISWPICLLAHALIHAGGVALVTGSIWLALLEFTFHALMDFVKCDGGASFLFDQSFHVGCKVLIAVGAVTLR